jgi:hypothetical protein
VSRPNLFLELLADVSPTWRAANDGLDDRRHVYAQLIGRELHPEFDATVTPAFSSLDVFGRPEDAADLAAVGEAGEAVDANLAAQQQDVPAPGQDGPSADGPAVPEPGDRPHRGEPPEDDVEVIAVPRRPRL